MPQDLRQRGKFVAGKSQSTWKVFQMDTLGQMSKVDLKFKTKALESEYMALQ